MHAETARWRHHEIERRSARARADYSSRNFVLESETPGEETVSHHVRDPRIDPQPGDVLVVDRESREVIDRVQDSIEYGFPNRAASRWITLIRWQVWARHAEVKKVAS